MDYLWPCLVFVWVAYLWETYLQWRQRRVYLTVREVPDELRTLLDQPTFDKARSYQLDKSSFVLVHSLYNQLELIVLLAVSAIPLSWNAAGWITGYIGLGPEYELSQSLVYLQLLLVYSILTNLPWSIYSTFVLEERHGFNKQTAGFFVKDQAKSLALQMLLVPLISLGLLYTIQAGGQAFFLYAWLFLAAVTFLWVTVYQEFIAPLFDTFSPLPEGVLHSAIRQLAASLSFPLGKIQVVEGSKRSAHSNAYLYGFWWNKCIVIFDTLLEAGLLARKEGEVDKGKEGVVDKGEEGEVAKGEEGEVAKGEEGEVAKGEEGEVDNGEEGVVYKGEEGEMDKGEEGEVKKQSGGKDEAGPGGQSPEKVTGCNQQEILGVLAHELGHWSLSHTLKLLTISQVNILVSLATFGYFVEQQDVYASFGFPDSRPTLIGLILIFQLIFIPYNELMQFVIVQVIRRFEYQADAFARKLGRGAALHSALAKLNRDNLSFPVADPVYSAFHHTHPTFLERVRRLPKLD